MKNLIIWLAILLPFYATAQVNTQLQKTTATSILRSFNAGAAGIDTIPAVRLTGITNGWTLIYNSTTKKFHAAAVSGSAWSLTGNSGTTPGTNFIGSTDNVGFQIKTNNLESAYIDEAGQALFTSRALAGNVNAFISVRDSGEARLTVKTFYDETPHVTADNYPMFQTLRNQKIVGTANYRPLVTGDIMGKYAMQAPRQSDGTYNGDGAHSIFGYAGENWSATQSGSYWGFSANSFGTNTTYFPLYLNSNTLLQASVAAVGDGVNPYVFKAKTTFAGSDAFTVSSAGVNAMPLLTSNGLLTTSGATGTIGITVPGTGVLTALGTNVGSAGAFVVNGGALGTPSSGFATNLSGTASGLTSGSVTNGFYTVGTQTAAGAKTFSSLITAPLGIQTAVPFTAGSGLTSAGVDTYTSATVYSGLRAGSLSFNNNGFALAIYPPSTLTANINITFPNVTGTLYTTATGSITSAQLATSLTDETGTGSAVFSASPTFTGTVTAPIITQVPANKARDVSPITGTGTVYDYFHNTGNDTYIGVESSTGASIFTGSTAYASVFGNLSARPVEFGTNSNVRYSISSAGAHDFKSGAATFGNLAGTGDRMVQASSTGVLSASQVVTSGVYTPTFTNVTNTASFTGGNAKYTRVGDQVFMQGRIAVTTTVGASTSTSFTISLPISSALTGTSDVIGAGVSTSSLAINGEIVGEPTADVAQLTFLSSTLGSIILVFNFMYTVK